MPVEFAEEVVDELRRLRRKARGRVWLLRNGGYRRRRGNIEVRVQRLLGVAWGLALAAGAVRRTLLRRIEGVGDEGE